MLQYQLLAHGIVIKQAVTVYKTGKQTAYIIVKLYKIEFNLMLE